MSHLEEARVNFLQVQASGAPSILQEADEIIHGSRNSDYGHPLDNHSLTAELWSSYFGEAFTPEDVCFMNILQKISRSTNTLTRDTLVDIAGYAGNVEMVQDERRRRDNGPVMTCSPTQTPGYGDGLPY